MNLVVLVGNLGKDPETRHFDGGRSCTSFSIATSDKWKDKKTGEAKEKTEWHNIVDFRAGAENAASFLKKGSKVAIQGKLTTSTYEKEGVKHWSTKIMVISLTFLDKKSGEDNNKSGNNNNAAGAHNKDNMYAQASQAVTKTPPPAEDDFEDDQDIPF